MPRIRQLPPDVVTKIAAGEVIERPASVVKELLENSVDAGATRIDIELEAGGTELIRVTDDGCGIAADELPLALASHATSKLQTAEDLFRISTMGFRGEALASIGGVAKVTLQSRTADAPTGAEIHCDGGTFSPVKPWGGAVGTRLEVRHLFFSVPVRKKFLKSIPTELGHVSETVTRLSLANPGLHLKLTHNGKLVVEVPASATLRDRIGLFFGSQVRDSLYEVDTGPGPVSLGGWIADPACDRGNAKLQYLFLNGRWFRDRSLSHAFQEAYRGLLMTNRYAVGFLFLRVPPDTVDVNVHPTKAEVRFRDNSVVYSMIRNVVKQRLLKENLVPKLTVPAEDWTLSVPPRASTESLFGGNPEPVAETLVDLLPPPGRGEGWGGGRFSRETSTPHPNPPPQGGRGPELAVDEVDFADNPSPQPPPRSGEGEPEIDSSSPLRFGEGSGEGLPLSAPRPVASQLQSLAIPAGTALQVHDAYLVLETPEGMLVIDQHALHERILYEQLRRRVRDGKLEVQRLLIPEPIELPAEQAAHVLDCQDALAELGLEVSDFGGNTVLLSSYPTLLSRRAPHEILQGVIDYLVSKDRPPAKEVLLDHLLATMACKAAVKAGDRLSPDEIAYLLHLRQLAEDSHHCPHGRPTSLLFSRQELDRQFKRV